VLVVTLHCLMALTLVARFATSLEERKETDKREPYYKEDRPSGESIVFADSITAVVTVALIVIAANDTITSVVTRVVIIGVVAVVSS
jgi:hypothetical protein